MQYQFSLNKSNLQDTQAKVYILITKDDKMPGCSGIDYFSDIVNKYIEKQLSLKNYLFQLADFEKQVFVQFINIKKDKEDFKIYESFRIGGSKLQKEIKRNKIDEISIYSCESDAYLPYYLEGLLLADYRFTKYKSEPEFSTLRHINFVSKTLDESLLNRIGIIVEAVYLARDLVNEPGSVLTATELADRITGMGNEAGFYTEILNKRKIEALKMGGLLAVNSGSIDPPTFTILHYNPQKNLNTKPIVLVGKGVVFDTGGLSLKPTLNSMDEMKSDMAGAAVVASVIYAIARLQLPVEVYGLIPATDNRPGEKACFPGDIVTISNGTTVEILNTDAEGRLILADALTYAKKLNPEMVIDLATLTGSASNAIGKYAMVAFTNVNELLDADLMNASQVTYERIVQFPVWDEYAELIKSDVADIKNTGGKEAGAITAAKFLQNFTDYPWIHLDIAGVSFSTSESNYLPKGGTGTGIRLLINYLTSKFSQNDNNNS
jgi:leucyl aminopeptidase